MPKSLYIIDGHSQIYRAYYAPFRSLTAPSGEPTRATYVFCQMWLNLIRDHQPDYLVTVLDSDESKLHRKQVYPEYKAQREPPPEDLPPQTERIVSILRAAGVMLLQREGYEADDLIATLVKRCAGGDFEVVIVSRDKDLEQLLGPRVAMLDPLKDERITPEALVQNKGWRPDQAIDAQILTGDTVDNVPGVPGIGPKTAAKLLQKYGSIGGILEHVDELTPKQRENVQAFAPQVEMVRSLVTLDPEVPIEIDVDAAATERLTLARVRPIFSELGFRRLLEQLPEGDEDDAATATPAPMTVDDATESSSFDAVAARLRTPEGTQFTLIDTADRLGRVVSELSEQSEFAIDTETTGVDAMDCELVGISLSWTEGEGYYIPVRSMYGDVLPLDEVRAALAPVLRREDTCKIGQNLKYDLLVLRNVDLPIAGELFDTMVAAFVVDPGAGSYGMDKLVHRYFGYSKIPTTDLIGKGKQQLRMDQVPVEHVAEYAAEDADYTLRLKRLLETQLQPMGVERLFREVEMPLVRVLTDMEYAGITLDVELLAGMSRELQARAGQIVDAVHNLAGGPFNLDSPKQLAEVLFDKLGYRVVRKTKTARSTDADTLDVLQRETGDEIFGLLLEYRELQKLRGTYVDALPLDRRARTGRVHTSYHQTGAVTGRLSSSEPNLQNIPIRTEAGRRVRRAFIPRSADELLIVADYSQVELRVLAHYSGDAALIRAFADNQDIHAFVAAQVNGVSLEDVSSEMRGRAKAVNFGIIYGQTAFGLSQATGMGRAEAQDFIDAYFDRYPQVRAFIDACVADARKTGRVRTILGRVRPIDNINSRNTNVRAQAERFAVNTVIQGSAADLIKLAMIQLHRRISEQELPLRMLLQVHDELVCEAMRDRADELVDVVRDVMTNAMELRVPLKVDVGTGKNWLEAK